MTLPRAQEQRRAAVFADGHAFVRASAGTGKTRTLALRALYLLLHGPFLWQKKQPATGRPDLRALYAAGASRRDRFRAARAVIRSLVLTTFTRKAAAEMQTRLYAYLDPLVTAPDAATVRDQFGEDDPLFLEVVEAALDRIGGPDAFDRLRDGATALAELAAELQVCTLHSFAAGLLRRYPVQTGLPPSVRFAEEDQTVQDDVATQVIERWWQHVLTDPDRHDQLRALLAAAPAGDLQNWLAVAFAQPWIVDDLPQSPPDPRQLAALVDAGRQLVAELVTVRKNATKVIALRDRFRVVLEDARAGRSGAWVTLGRFLADHEKELFDPSTKAVADAIGRLDGAKTFFEDYAATAQLVLGQALTGELAVPWQIWQQFLRGFIDWADTAAVRELGLVTYDTMVRLAVRVLRDHPAVRAAERDRLRAVLVDEFQDTDPEQLALLQLLLRRQRDEPAVLGFFVGDSKQSIYRFRGADLPALKRFEQQYAELAGVPPAEVKSLTLSATFRCRPVVTRFVNRYFEQEVPLPDYAKQMLDPVRPDTGPATEWRVLRSAAGKIPAGERQRFAAWETVRLIREHARGKRDPAAAYGELLVLVKTHDELTALLEVLDEAGIPVISTGARTFYRHLEVLDTLNLLLALQHPQDTMAVAAVLRSPLVALADDQLPALLGNIPAQRLIHSADPLPPDLPPAAAARIESLRTLARTQRTLPLRSWLRQVRELIPAAVYSPRDRDGRALVRIDSVLTAFGAVVGAGLVPPVVWLLGQRDRSRDTDRWDSDLGEDVSITDERIPAVRAMTIHKAKGLEAPYVIVYGWESVLRRLDRRGARRSPALRLTGPKGEVRGFRLAWGPLEFVSAGYAAAVELDRRDDEAEATRLAYVAATRARDRLVLLGHEGDGRPAPGLGALRDAPAGTTEIAICNGTARCLLLPYAADKPHPAPESVKITRPAAYRKLWEKRLAALAQGDAPLLHRPSQPEQAAEEDVTELTDYRPDVTEDARAVALATGTLVHAYLERHLLDEEFAAANLQALVGPAIDLPDPTAARARATAALQSFYAGAPADSTDARYLDRVRRAVVLGRELPVYLEHDGRHWV
ncbi:UvrD-helicase domain-containing protein, partial [bacterium]|nr:UvrD-helicase domain-containing protein [bacterium]